MCEQIISKHNAQRTCCWVNRIETYCYFHSLWKINGISVCQINSKSLFQSRTAIRETVFNYKILWFLCINKRCNISLLACDHRLHVLYSKCFQVSCNLLTRSWSNLVDHCPRECYNILIADIINKICIYKTSLSPFFCHHQYRLPKLCTILRTVIHRYQCQWVFSCFISFKKHRYKHCHRSCYLLWSVLDVVLYKREPASVCFLKCISFFCNCKGN